MGFNSGFKGLSNDVSVYKWLICPLLLMLVLDDAFTGKKAETCSTF